jgi:ectoine hydroxylase-related dioxygenase (phytanoyl-CoA dioxygenase family)
MYEVAEAPVKPAAQLPQLKAAGKLLRSTPDRLGWLQPTDPGIGMAALKARYRATGYLWLKGLLDRDEVMAFRRHVFSRFVDLGMIARGSDPGLGIYSGTPPASDESNRMLMALVRSAAYESFCVQERLWRFMDAFLGGMSYLHKRKIMRHTLPGTPTVTPAHYDLVYLRGGTDRVVTAWIPIGDVPAEMGGLVYLEGSHAIGTRMEEEFRIANAALSPEERISAYNKNMTEGGWVSKDLPDMAERFNTRWLAADYEAGDVMLHSPYMIHASTLNEDGENRIRLSTDIRYQNVMDEIDVRWNNHWSLGDML